MVAILVSAVLAASPVSDVSVTIYRAPKEHSSSLNLDGLEGFALVTETRTVEIPKGETLIRFEGVADGIEPQSALITGLPEGVLEKNHDAHVLSPAALVMATLGRKTWLVRTSRKTGKTTSVAGTLTAANDGLLFSSSEGIEALRCSGLPETLHFDAATDAAATPTLSALVRSPQATTATVRLSYLAHGFDWMATYSATVSPDGKTLDLGAWVTLANSNGISFKNAHAQVVAGRLNRVSGEVEPVEEDPEIVANCWPMGTTSDIPEPEPPAPAQADKYEEIVLTGTRRQKLDMPMAFNAARPPPPPMVEEEQLGDLKLYRVPERTSVTSRQIKQVRLLDRTSIPVQLIYRADMTPDFNESRPLEKILRTRNDAAHHLGLPLPSGRVSAFYEHDGMPLLVNEAPLRDIAVDEEVEIKAGESPDVRQTTTVERRQVDPARNVNRLEVTNARKTAISVEIRLHLLDGTNVVRSDHVLTTRNGLKTFQLTVPPQGSATIRFETERLTR